MMQPQQHAVEMIAGFGRHGSAAGIRDPARPVKRVAQKRVPGRRHVDPYLVRASRIDPDAYEGTILAPFQARNMT